MPQNPAPFAVLGDLVDELEEALKPQDDTTRALLRELQAQFAQTDLQRKAARSLERNGLSRHTQDLLRQMGFEVRRIA